MLHPDPRGRRRPLLAPTLAAALAPAVLAPAAQAAPAAVTAGGDRFSPAAVTVETGEAVTWDFADGAHNVKGDGWSGNNDFGRGSWSRTFASVGTYAYVCEAHPSMRGTVTVTAPAVGAPSPAPAAALPGAGSGRLDADATAAWAFPAAEDLDAPVLGAVRATLPRRGRVRLSVGLGEDATVLVVLRRALRARGAAAERTIRLRGRRGSNRFLLPRGLRAGTRLTVVAVDAEGNESDVATTTLRKRRTA
jgi:plastocyanin